MVQALEFMAWWFGLPGYMGCVHWDRISIKTKHAGGKRFEGEGLGLEILNSDFTTVRASREKIFSTTIKLEQAGAGTCTSCPNVQAVQVLGSRVVRLSSGFPRKSKGLGAQVRLGLAAWGHAQAHA